jgi:ABC-type uncharacterized transport system substrate-binding protein
MVAELVRRQVAVIVANTPGAPEVKAATTTIPIVFLTGNDPVQIGLVASLSRPGSNVTGVTTLNVEVEPKLLELLHATNKARAARGGKGYITSGKRKERRERAEQKARAKAGPR